MIGWLPHWAVVVFTWVGIVFTIVGAIELVCAAWCAVQHRRREAAKWAAFRRELFGPLR